MADRPAGLRGRDVLGGSFEMWCAVGEAVPDILILVSRDGTILYVNRAPGAFALDKVLGTSVFDLAHGVERDELAASFAEAMRGGESHMRALAARHPDGAIHWYSIHTGPVRVDGQVVAAVIVARDITERKRVEDALRESEERYRTVMEHAPEAIVVFDVDAGRFVDVNRNACALFGMTRDALLQANPAALSPPIQPDGELSSAAAQRFIGEALSGATPVFDWIHRTPCDLDLRCHVRLVRLPAKGRRLVRGSVTDVTRQRQLEDHVQQLQKVEALGQLAGGVAHDFNNVLSVISSAIEVLSAELQRAGVRDADVSTEIEDIRAAARRGAAFTSELLGFARQRPAELQRVDLNAVITDVTTLMRRLMPKDLELVTRLDASGAYVSGHQSRLEQVVMNLLLNARDATPSGGRITISTVSGRLPFVRLRVQDTGEGMDEATRQRVFEPLFTTKPEGKGTGFGLSTLHAIVTQLGGHVEVTSELGVGSSFEVTLPNAG
ncbi:MAG TPA: PAS domain S-box protein [Gemmatimonadaceae bacterium]|nr:PAS domain S-box protein [Gemmatimonadaceae bacterium]